jgi:hypothetical protein
MNGLPSDTQLDFFRGKTLTQACFGPYDLILNFEENISISIESSIGVSLAGEKLARLSNFGEASREILHLLNRSVEDVRWTCEGTITLIFGGGCVFQIYDDNADFESYTITSPIGLVVV